MILMSNIEIENMDLSNNDISNFPIILIILILENSKYKMDNKPKYIPGMVRKVVVTSTTNEVLSKVGSSNDDTSNHYGTASSHQHSRVKSDLIRSSSLQGFKGPTDHDTHGQYNMRRLHKSSGTTLLSKIAEELWTQSRLLINWIKGVLCQPTCVGSYQRNVDEYGISISLADLVKAGFLRNNDRYLMNFISLFDKKEKMITY
ncbi:hypothetical protein RhiirC2_793717 [Rhizophagus irregularis]|uniref:Uncharacterized protein n=1 Tax=Rhizophagus irregularis TaxID=588596 RepID=A0A2N1MET9_9GLOM|nr:hypothetical protein RhiirC2_793717 [Rhizophagus irregularis]